MYIQDEQINIQFGSKQSPPPLHSMVLEARCRKPDQDSRGLAWESGYYLRRLSERRDGNEVLD